MGCFPTLGNKYKFTIRIYLIAVLLWMIYSEYITYWTLSSTWFKPPQCASPECKKILLVSDPQIIGREWHGLYLFDLFAMWDSDRYLRRTFHSAYNYIKPDIIIFLGDLMDQGYFAENNEFQSYTKRLHSIFHLSKLIKEKALILVIPGDNDIGGLDEMLISNYVDRFNKIFNQTENCKVIENIEFCEGNVMLHFIQKSKFIDSDVMVRVLLSHVPLIADEPYFLNKAVIKTRPHLIFSGHLHSGYHYTTEELDLRNFKHSQFYPSDTKLKTYKFHKGMIHEIIVPTCSYRMGVKKMGYGVAFLDTKKKLVQFSILWLPKRLTQLLIHSIVLFPVGLLILLWSCQKVRKFRIKRFLRSPNKYAAFP